MSILRAVCSSRQETLRADQRPTAHAIASPAVAAEAPAATSGNSLFNVSAESAISNSCHPGGSNDFTLAIAPTAENYTSGNDTATIGDVAKKIVACCTSCDHVVQCAKLPRCNNVALLFHDGGDAVSVGEGGSARVLLAILEPSPIAIPTHSTFSIPPQQDGGDRSMKVVDGHPGLIVAVKVLHVPNRDGEQRRHEMVHREVTLMAELASASTHPGIVRMYGVLSPQALMHPKRQRYLASGDKVIPCPHEIGLVMDYCDGGSLHNLVDTIARAGTIPADAKHAAKENRTTLLEREVVAILYAVASALMHLHNDFRMIHRDVKPANIFLCKSESQTADRPRGANDQPGDVRSRETADCRARSSCQEDAWRVKLGDYGVSSCVDTASTQCGTKRYMAPEILVPSKDTIKQKGNATQVSKGAPTYGPAVDVFSFGVTMQHVASGGCHASLRRQWVIPPPPQREAVGAASHVKRTPPKLSAAVDDGVHWQISPASLVCARCRSQSMDQRMPQPPAFFGSASADAETQRSHVSDSFGSCRCDNLHSDLIQLMNSMVDEDPGKRPSLREVVLHPAVLRLGHRRPALTSDAIDLVDGACHGVRVPSVQSVPRDSSSISWREACPCSGFDMWNPPSLRFLCKVNPFPVFAGNAKKTAGVDALGGCLPGDDTAKQSVACSSSGRVRDARALTKRG